MSKSYIDSLVMHAVLSSILQRGFKLLEFNLPSNQNLKNLKPFSGMSWPSAGRRLVS